MKEVKIIIIAVVVTIAIIFSCAYAMPANAEGKNPNFGEFYPRLSIVIQRHPDAVICQDKEGNLWAFLCDESDGWQVGDLCNLMMWNTDENIENHEVIEVYWEGYVEHISEFFSLDGWR